VRSQARFEVEEPPMKIALSLFFAVTCMAAVTASSVQAEVANGTSLSTLRGYVSTCLRSGEGLDVSGSWPTDRSQVIHDAQATTRLCKGERVLAIINHDGLRRLKQHARDEAYTGVVDLELAAGDLITWYAAKDRWSLRQARSEYNSGVGWSQYALRDLHW
jgi:hypothetical protein